MKALLGKGAIEIDGEGHGVTISEICRVTILFREMFGVEPRIRVTGRFERDAIGQVPGGDGYVDTWDLRHVHGSGYCDVLSVGPEHVYVQTFSGLNNNRAIMLAPGRGTMVKVRLLLPKEP